MSDFLSQEEIDALLNGGSKAAKPEAKQTVAGQESVGEETGGETAGVAQEEAAAAENPEVMDTIQPELDTARSGSRLTPEEEDVLGEIGNISMGSAATVLSQLLNQKVVITSPRVRLVTQEELFTSFSFPYMAVEVDYTKGLKGMNLLIIKKEDAAVIADLMMGGDGSNPDMELTEIHISAASEAMNQMIGSAATSMSAIFHQEVNISPPRAQVREKEDHSYRPFATSDSVVVIAFQMIIGDLVDTEIMQLLTVETARAEARLLMGLSEVEMANTPASMPAGAAETAAAASSAGAETETGLPEAGAGHVGGAVAASAPGAGTPRGAMAGFGPAVSGAAAAAAYASAAGGPGGRHGAGGNGATHGGLAGVDPRKMELIMDIPLRVSVILGRSRKPIREILNLTAGAVVELDRLVDEPVEVLVNGTLVARGEVVAVNENFGVRITNIISPEERINYLRK